MQTAKRCISLAIFCAMLIHNTGCESRKISGGWWAYYPGMAFHGDPDTFISFYTGNEKYNFQIAPVWIRLKDGEIIELSKLPEERAREWEVQKRKQQGDAFVTGIDNEGIGVSKTLHFSTGINGSGCSFVFSEGRLISCAIRTAPDSELDGVQIGNSQDGEFLSFPIRRDDLIRVFGKPTKIEESWYDGPPI